MINKGSKILILLSTLYFLWGCVRPYSEVAHDLGKKIEEIFVKDGLCDAEKECMHIKVDGGGDFVMVNVYAAGGLDKKIVEALVGVCLSVYKENNKEIELNFYTEAHDDVRSIFSFKEPFLYMKFATKK